MALSTFLVTERPTQVAFGDLHYLATGTRGWFSGRGFHGLLLLLALVLLSACGTAPKRPPAPVTPPIDQAAAANRLAKTGDHAAAALAYRDLAAQALPPQRQSYQLAAADNLLQAADYAELGRLLPTIDVGGLHPRWALQKRLLSARLALALADPAAAARLLEAPPSTLVPDSLLQDYHSTRADAFHLAGNALESSRSLIALDALATDAATRQARQNEILQRLSDLPDATLDLLQEGEDPILRGWMELARVYKAAAGRPDLLPPRLQAWRRNFPDHPASPDGLEPDWQHMPHTLNSLRHLAILLPQSGDLAGVAGAVSEGILAGYYQLPLVERPVLRFYDTETTDVTELYRQAEAAGAAAVLGPLQKEAVTRLAEQDRFPVPVLTLNRPENPAQDKPGLYQFGLAPEDEALQAAELAWADGFRSGLLLYSDDSWGQRVSAALSRHWQALGGQPLVSQGFVGQGEALDAPVRQLLSGGVGRDNCLFLIAKSQDARRIWPYVRYHGAKNVRTYATSHVYNKSPDPVAYLDWEGVRFPELPLVIAQHLAAHPAAADPMTAAPIPAAWQRFAQQQAPSAQGSASSFFALGLDAFELVGQLDSLRLDPRLGLEGASGRLSLDPGGRVVRRLPWLVFHAGQIELLDPEPGSL